MSCKIDFMALLLLGFIGIGLILLAGDTLVGAIIVLAGVFILQLVILYKKELFD